MEFWLTSIWSGSFREVERGAQKIMRPHTSFTITHKVGNVDIFVLPKFENMTDNEIHHIN